MTTGIGTRIAKCTVLRMCMSEDDITGSTSPYNVRRIAHIARVGMVEQTRAAYVAGEDAILSLSGSVVLVVGRAGGQVRPPERTQADGATAISTVEPDLFAVVPTIVAQEVAHRKVLHRHTIRLQDLDPLTPSPIPTNVLNPTVPTATRPPTP